VADVLTRWPDIAELVIRCLSQQARTREDPARAGNRL